MIYNRLHNQIERSTQLKKGRTFHWFRKGTRYLMYRSEKKIQVGKKYQQKTVRIYLFTELHIKKRFLVKGMHLKCGRHLSKATVSFGWRKKKKGKLTNFKYILFLQSLSFYFLVFHSFFKFSIEKWSWISSHFRCVKIISRVDKNL